MCIVYLTTGEQIPASYVRFEGNCVLIGDACYSASLIEDIVQVNEEDCWKHM